MRNQIRCRPFLARDFIDAMVKHLPTLMTDRLCLRPFLIDDAPQVQNLAGAREVYATTFYGLVEPSFSRQRREERSA
ncbi:hypothetical protein CAI21_20045 [Alkalilimnicola ehrlichii]|uniref:Uncharacterized protein n=1 Tax=Alkalilimnicola ehrlichii TaxID=351052 RepID=A0A3E0X2H1_9GAMM|nr:hypothetical protein CAI21_20045 [Alkalilimnicola ehrlichii]RFA38793.1 hypothetical protein CAL65_02450 [Alkalilimnicola ehrlichii]